VSPLPLGRHGRTPNPSVGTATLILPPSLLVIAKGVRWCSSRPLGRRRRGSRALSQPSSAASSWEPCAVALATSQRRGSSLARPVAVPSDLMPIELDLRRVASGDVSTPSPFPIPRRQLSPLEVRPAPWVAARLSHSSWVVRRWSRADIDERQPGRGSLDRHRCR
jgi:hypothetical protein